MGGVYEEFERQLALWRDQYATRPREEMIRLCLLALEREEIVSVAYREKLIVERLRTMPVSAEVRDIVHHALLWAWKDEEMHAVYIRGMILRLGESRLRISAYLRQTAGALGGWASSVSQHVPWRTAPLSRAAAALFSWSGFLFGQVPAEVLRHLRYTPFRQFCLFNVEAERTAKICWRRLADLAERQPGFQAALVADFRRVHADEHRHEQVFQILAEAFDEQDRLLAAQTAEALATKIRAVSEFFLPRSLRGPAAATHPLGTGGKVWVAEGRTPREKLRLFRQVLEESGLAALIGQRAAMAGKPLRQITVAVKPAFMMGYDRRDTSVITDPELLAELTRYLLEIGCGDVAMIEGRNIYDWFYGNRTVHEVARYFGLGSSDYRIVDSTEEQVPHKYFRGMAQYTVGRTWKNAEFRITFGKMRSHPVEHAYLTVGNVEWIGARCDQYLFAERQAERETAIMMLLDEFPPHFAILDAYDEAADGLVGVMGCHWPKSPKRLYASADALALDIVAGRHMGMKNPRDSRILRAACHWFGSPETRIEVVGTDDCLRDWRGPYHNDISAMLGFFAYPVYVFGSLHGSLFLSPVDETAFPPVRPVSPALRLARGAVQRLLGIHRRQ